MSNFTDPNCLGISGEVLAAYRTQRRAAFAGYLSVDHPDVAKSREAYRVLCGGADMMEIGMPYSDPFLDGPVIQYATTRVLARGIRTRDALTAAETVASCGKVPVVMTYWNLIEQYGPDTFARDLAAAGGAGVIAPDLTSDEAGERTAATDVHDLDGIFLITPSNTPERITMTMTACRGWVYTASVMEVTDMRRGTSLAALVIAARAWEIDLGLPVGVDMGAGSGGQAAEVGAYADAIIVGSTLVRCLASDGADVPGDLEKLGVLAAELLEGVRRSR